MPTTQSGGNWLGLGGTGTGSIYDMAPQVDASYAAELPPGTYYGAYNFMANGATVGTLPVTLTVTGPGVIVTPTALTFSGTYSQQQTIQFSAPVYTQAQAISRTFSGGSTWLSISPGGLVSCSDSSSTSIQVTANPAGLPPGTYTGEIDLTPSFVSYRAVNGQTQRVPVTLTVTSNEIAASAPSLSFAIQAGASAPPAQTLAVTTKSGSNGVYFAYTSSANWLTISGSGTATTPATLTVSVNPAGLAPGPHTANFTLIPSGQASNV